jgi:hypothetical protein
MAYEEYTSAKDLLFYESSMVTDAISWHMSYSFSDEWLKIISSER